MKARNRNIYIVFTLLAYLLTFSLFSQEKSNGQKTQGELRMERPFWVSIGGPGDPPAGLQAGYVLGKNLTAGIYASPERRESTKLMNSNLLHPVFVLFNGAPMSYVSLKTKIDTYGIYMKYFFSDTSGWYLPVGAGYTIVNHKYTTMGNGYLSDNNFRYGKHSEIHKYGDYFTGVGYKHWFNNGLTLEYSVTGGFERQQATSKLKINQHLYVSDTGTIDVNESLIDYLHYRETALRHDNEKTWPLFEMGLHVGFAF